MVVSYKYWCPLRFCFAVANEVKQKPCSLQERPSTDANSVCARASNRTCSTIFAVSLTTSLKIGGDSVASQGFYRDAVRILLLLKAKTILCWNRAKFYDTLAKSKFMKQKIVLQAFTSSYLLRLKNSVL